MLIQSFSKSVLLIRYHLNKKYYSEVLCSNRGLIVIDCEGRCRLLKDVEEEEKRSTHIPGKETIDLSVLPPDYSITFSIDEFDCCWSTIYYTSHSRSGWISLPYKPPRLTFLT